MKPIIIVFVASLLSSFVSSAQDFTIDNNGLYPKAIFHKKHKSVKVSAGKMVTLKTVESLNSNNLITGQIVKLLVDVNVVENGKTVIKSNSFALGRIKDVQQGSINHRESITIEVTSVQTIDGQQVQLNGQEQIFMADAPGENVVWPAGKTMIAYFKNDEKIDLD